MGEAKRRAVLPCLCGSKRPSADCCFKNGQYFREPSPINLYQGKCGTSLEDCYLNGAHCCGGGLSREHLISESVLRVIKIEQLTVSGLPWLPNGEPKKIGFNELVAKCLCKDHNSALSPLDAAAAIFFDALRQADLNRSGPAFIRIVSGHDIERWMLKTLFGFAHSKNLANEGTRLKPIFRKGIDPVAMLANVNAWPTGAGLSFQQEPGSDLLRSDEFGLAPHTVANEIVGMKSSIQGVALDLRAVPFDTTSPGIVRPSEIRFRHPNVMNKVILCWLDSQPHEHIEVTFSMTQAEADARGIQLPHTLRN